MGLWELVVHASYVIMWVNHLLVKDVLLDIFDIFDQQVIDPHFNKASTPAVCRRWSVAPCLNTGRKCTSFWFTNWKSFATRIRIHLRAGDGTPILGSA